MRYLVDFSTKKVDKSTFFRDVLRTREDPGMPEKGHTISTHQLLPLQVARLHGLLNAQAKAIISRHASLTLPQWRIIRMVGMGFAETSTDVRKATNLDKSQFSKTLASLADDGFLTLSAYEGDLRQIHIQLTEKGCQAHDRLAPELDARHEHLMSALTPEQRASIYSAIQALSEAASTTDFSEIKQAQDGTAA